MRISTLLTWGLTILIAAIAALPAAAQGINDWHGRDNIRIVTVDRQEHDRVFLSWFGAQVKIYNDIDPDSNVRTGDLLQLIDEVNGNHVWLTDQQNNRREIFAARHTEVVFSNLHRPDVITDGHLADFVTPGDLVVVQGHLRADGGFMANKIRIVGHAWGWNADDNPVSDEIGTGVRYWGTVMSINIDAGTCEVNTSDGPRRMRLTRDGEVLHAGRAAVWDSLRIGDRVVFYADLDTPRAVAAYRLVILAQDDPYPSGVHIYRYDPDRYLHKPAVVIGAKLAGIEGHVDYLATGPNFHKLAIRTDDGRSRIVYVAKSMNVFRGGGARISLLDLKASDHLHISFREVNGNTFATRIEVR